MPDDKGQHREDELEEAGDPAEQAEAAAHATDPEGPTTFQVWKEYEKVAVHFNDLIMRLRIQALGGVAAIAAVAGIVLKESGSSVNAEMQWRMLAVTFLALIFFWVAILVLDFFYYTALLYGAVEAIIQLETNNQPHERPAHINLSGTIQESLRHPVSGLGRKRGLLGPLLFYIIVLIALGLLCRLSFQEAGKQRRATNAQPATVPTAARASAPTASNAPRKQPAVKAVPASSAKNQPSANRLSGNDRTS